MFRFGVLLACALAAVMFASAQVPSITPAPAFSARELTQYPTTGWLTNGGDLFNRRYSPLTQINTDNVAQLKAVWRTRLGG